MTQTTASCPRAKYRPDKNINGVTYYIPLYDPAIRCMARLIIDAIGTKNEDSTLETDPNLGGRGLLGYKVHEGKFFVYEHGADGLLTIITLEEAHSILRGELRFLRFVQHVSQLD